MNRILAAIDLWLRERALRLAERERAHVVASLRAVGNERGAPLPVIDLGADYWAEQAVEDVHFFTAFDGIAGAAFNARCPDGVLRPFEFKAGGQHARIVFCLVMLHNGHTEVGTNFAPADGSPYDAELGRKMARAAAMSGVKRYLAFMVREDRYRHGQVDTSIHQEVQS